MDVDYEENLNKGNSYQAVEDNKRNKSTFSKALYAAKPTFDPSKLIYLLNFLFESMNLKVIVGAKFVETRPKKTRWASKVE